MLFFKNILVNFWIYYRLYSHFHPSCRQSLCSKLCPSYTDQLGCGYEWCNHRLQRCCITRPSWLPQSRCWWNWRTHSRPRSLQVDNERDRNCCGCHHKRKFHWCVDFPDDRIPQCSKREKSNTCWRRVGEECLLASCIGFKRRNNWASGGYCVKQDHWSAPDGCVDEWENFGTDRCYLWQSNSHAALGLKNRVILVSYISATVPIFQ